MVGSRTVPSQKISSILVSNRKFDCCYSRPVYCLERFKTEKNGFTVFSNSKKELVGLPRSRISTGLTAINCYLLLYETCAIAVVGRRRSRPSFLLLSGDLWGAWISSTGLVSGPCCSCCWCYFLLPLLLLGLWRCGLRFVLGSAPKNRRHHPRTTNQQLSHHRHPKS